MCDRDKRIEQKVSTVLRQISCSSRVRYIHSPATAAAFITMNVHDTRETP
jgi:hypothetical protein